MYLSFFFRRFDEKKIIILNNSKNNFTSLIRRQVFNKNCFFFRCCWQWTCFTNHHKRETLQHNDNNALNWNFSFYFERNRAKTKTPTNANDHENVNAYIFEIFYLIPWHVVFENESFTHNYFETKFNRHFSIFIIFFNHRRKHN